MAIPITLHMNHAVAAWEGAATQTAAQQPPQGDFQACLYRPADSMQAGSSAATGGPPLVGRKEQVGAGAGTRSYGLHNGSEAQLKKLMEGLRTAQEKGPLAVQEIMRRVVSSGELGAIFGNESACLLALQYVMLESAQQVELVAKIVEHSAASTKQVLQTQA